MKSRLGKLLPSLLLLALFGSLSLLAADLLLGYWTSLPYRNATTAAGADFDPRERLDVLIDYRAQDPNWYPAVPANTFIQHHLKTEDGEILPLTAVPLAKTIGCSEGGFYSTYHTDELGFNNPEGSWSKLAPDSLFFVGDSFTQGSCLNQGGGYVDQMRKLQPHVINIASGGNGPLLELASIREYVPGDSHGTVFWGYYEGNDLMDLNRDRSDPLLMNYLDPDFKQNLWLRREQVAETVTHYVDQRFTSKIEGRAILLPNIRLALWRLRKKANTASNDERTADPGPQHDTKLLIRLLTTARDEIETRGGRFVFVYLPEFYRFGPGNLSYWAEQRDEVLAAVRDAGLEVIDLTPAFNEHPDPVGLFPLRRKGHYNEAGYALVAGAINDYLKTHQVLTTAQ